MKTLLFVAPNARKVASLLLIFTNEAFKTPENSIIFNVMKLRIKGNSIRLRLTQGEVAKFIADGKLVETVEFGDEPNQFFSYQLLKSETAESVSAEFNNGSISVFVPQNTADDWANGEQIGIASVENSKIKILVEKDFACLAPRKDEDESDNFPHPKTEKVC